MKKYLFALAGVLAVVAIPNVGRATRVEADPNREYIISPDAGPFAILVKPYSGDDARASADRLTLYLRQHGWLAYVFDYTAEIERKNQEFLEARYKDIPPEARPHKMIRVQPQWGVFIGGYRDFESASSDIPKVKKTPEPPFENSSDYLDPVTNQLYHQNVFAQCIATRNPTMRMQQTAANAPDPAWKRLNEGRPYNLLTKCPKEWTLVVKQFQGAGAVQPRSESSSFLDHIGLGSNSGDMLEASAKQAEEMARWIEEAWKIPAYVLHTRTGSIVTVGAYDSVDDPAMQELARKLAGHRFGNTPDAIQLFVRPLPMRVPRL